MVAEIIEFRGAGAAGGAEDTAEGGFRGGGTNEKAETGDAVCTEFFQGFTPITFSIAEFITVVVGKFVREDLNNG